MKLQEKHWKISDDEEAEIIDCCEFIEQNIRIIGSTTNTILEGSLFGRHSHFRDKKIQTKSE